MIPTLADLREQARKRLAPAHDDFFAGGAADERAARENERAFHRLALLPRVLRGAAHRDLTLTLLGDRLTMPVLVSPTAFHRLAHPEGERATARATAAAGTVLIASMASTVPVAEVTAAARAVRADAPVWFQLYLQPEPDITRALVDRAEQAGCTALVITADSPVFGRRERDARNGFDDLPPGLATENMRHLPGADGDRPRDIAMSPALSWDDLRRLRAHTTLPVVLKGVLHPADARIAVAEGIDALLVSNHGGRQLDAAPAAVEALPRIVAAVAGRVPVLLDGGVRRGSDAAIALALGATAVGIGRPALWGLAADGERGVTRVLELLRAEFDHALALCGGSRSADLTPDLVVTRGRFDDQPGLGGPERGAAT
ncbi:alpha-hydroxy acid oxidase [Streptomyces varsoviensis]|uniref:alpha-hydroxy acid oxidase n=1 Tax=Streptomyces varsoviensis TaxID=67373 RepID=UPI0033D41030